MDLCINKWVGRCLDGRAYGFMYEQMGWLVFEWQGRWIYVWINGLVGAWMGKQMDFCMNKWLGWCLDTRTDGFLYEQMAWLAFGWGGQMGLCMNKWVDGWVSGSKYMDRRKHFFFCLSLIKTGLCSQSATWPIFKPMIFGSWTAHFMSLRYSS